MTQSIAIVVFDGCDEMDVFGPFEILASAGFDVGLAAVRPGPIRSMRGVELQIRQPLEPSDGILVPGGGWNNRAAAGLWAELRRGELPELITELDASAQWLGSVCSGGMLLANAGLLRESAATTNRHCFAEFAPLVGELVDERVVDDGRRITSGAIFSGVDLGLHITERELGPEAVADVVARVEYQRQGRVWRR